MVVAPFCFCSFHTAQKTKHHEQHHEHDIITVTVIFIHDAKNEAKTKQKFKCETQLCKLKRKNQFGNTIIRTGISRLNGT